jgi:malonyl-CoA O-methyltransferase
MADPAVVRRFSASAPRYDAHAHAQRLSAADLLTYTRRTLPRNRRTGPFDEYRILEPGCGTGLYTRMILDAFPGAQVDAVDISEVMVRIAREHVPEPGARFAVADVEEMGDGTYDLITSNAAFQWFQSFPRTVARLAAFLSPGGVLTFSFFGPGTYAELDEALRDAPPRSGGGRAAAANFLSRDEIAAALSACFPRWDIVERRYRQVFPDLTALLKNIRYTGTGGGKAPGPWSPGRLARVERVYRERYGGIRATYQVFLCRGVVPDGGGA